MPRWISVLALVSIISLAVVGVRVCVAMVGHSMEQCHDCAASMGVSEHLAWWQGQLLGVATPASEMNFIAAVVLAAFIIFIFPVLVPSRQLAYAWYRRQRFRPPERDYLSALLSDGILNPKIFSVVR